MQRAMIAAVLIGGISGVIGCFIVVRGMSFFGEALDRATALGAAMEMRFHALEHFNSSTITAVIELIQEARARNVRLVIAYDGAVKWQRLSFDAMRVFNRGDALLELRPS